MISTFEEVSTIGSDVVKAFASKVVAVVSIIGSLVCAVNALRSTVEVVSTIGSEVGKEVASKVVAVLSIIGSLVGSV